VKVEIRRLTATDEAEYSDLLVHSPQAMLYHSIKYRGFLNAILKNAEDHYLLAHDDGHLVAALPAFVKQGPMGVVVNSLPFYGSHGSIISRIHAPIASIQALLSAFHDLCRQQNAICSTIIANPLETNTAIFAQYPSDFTDERIGQISHLPSNSAERTINDQLMESIHPKTRNMVRKGEKSGFVVGHEGSTETLAALYALHEKNIGGIGGIPKGWDVFQSIAAIFDYDRDYRLYFARNKDGQIVSGLLVFFYKDTIEYFVPATHEDYRSQQPLSLLIFTAMKDAVRERHSRLWNWGGTWLTQAGVYHFKSRWGARDYPYRYYIREYPMHGRIDPSSREALLRDYPYFYTIPFHKRNA